MKTIKLGLGIVALSMSANAWAMPQQVKESWYDQMRYRIEIMIGNPGFCRSVPAWFC